MAVVWIDVIAGEFLKGEDERDWGMFGEFAKQAPKAAAYFSKLNAEGYYLLSCLRGVKAKDIEKIAQETPFPENMVIATKAAGIEYANADSEAVDENDKVEDEQKNDKSEKKSSKKKEPEPEPEPEDEDDDDLDDDDEFDFDFD